jgi:protein-S-isoprenylcysteine O-methyltransferase
MDGSMDSVDAFFSLTCVLWFAYEVYLIVSHKGKTKDEKTKGNRLFLFLFFVAIVVGINFAYVPFSSFPDFRSGYILIGTAIIWLGIILRYWAIRTLGKFFTTVIGMQKGHRLVKGGPYRYIRHPSYTGALITVFGFGIALRNLIGLILMMAIVLFIYKTRIDYEEKVLTSNFGKEYKEYAKNTKRLIPWVY